VDAWKNLDAALEAKSHGVMLNLSRGQNGETRNHLDALLGAAINDDGGALLGKRRCDGQANTGCGARYKSGLAFQSKVHTNWGFTQPAIAAPAQFPVNLGCRAKLQPRGQYRSPVARYALRRLRR